MTVSYESAQFDIGRASVVQLKGAEGDSDPLLPSHLENFTKISSV